MSWHEQRERAIKARRTRISILFAALWVVTVVPTAFVGLLIEGEWGRVVTTLGPMLVSLLISGLWGWRWLEAES